MLPILWKHRDSLEGTPFDDFVDRFFYGWPSIETNSETIWSPRVDVNETDHEVLLDVEIPGIDKKDIKVEVKNNTLSISGERKQENKTENDEYSRIERRYGKFERSFGLPDTLVPDSVTAKYKDGILTLTLKKTDKAKPKEIAVEVK